MYQLPHLDATSSSVVSLCGAPRRRRLLLCATSSANAEQVAVCGGCHVFTCRALRCVRVGVVCCVLHNVCPSVCAPCRASSRSGVCVCVAPPARVIKTGFPLLKLVRGQKYVNPTFGYLR